MSRLVVVSNRVADLKGGAQSGGLAVALSDVLAESGGVWVGSDTQTTASGALRREQVGDVTCLYVGLTGDDHAQYYLGFANSVLWPLFHYRADLVAYQSEDFDGYVRVNRKFARALLSTVSADDLV